MKRFYFSTEIIKIFWRILCRKLPGSDSHFFSFIYISWRLIIIITLRYCSGFCHTLIWISHGFTCVPHPEPPSHFSPHPIPLGLPSAPALSTCLMHPTWTGDLFHNWWYTCFNAILSDHPTFAIIMDTDFSGWIAWLEFGNRLDIGKFIKVLL